MRPVIDGHVFQHVTEGLAGIISVKSDPFRSELNKEKKPRKRVK